MKNERLIHAALPESGAAVWFRIGVTAAILTLVAGCAAPPPKPAGPSAEEIAKQQKLERAQTNLGEGIKKYGIGAFDDAMSNFLLALDSGQLTLAQHVTARKHMAFVHCLSGREAVCKEEFEKIFTLDPTFDLSPAESGHPIWGPVHRLARVETELRRSGRTLPVAAVKPLTSGEKLMKAALASYDEADYNTAIKSFQDALKETLSDADRIIAHKLMAFSFCLTNRSTLCRAEFDLIFKIDPNFDLAPAEAGHPSWGPSFRTVKVKRKSALPKKP
jgi:tetratricopeptide (TPR) repeat protein